MATVASDIHKTKRQLRTVDNIIPFDQLPAPPETIPLRILIDLVRHKSTDDNN